MLPIGSSIERREVPKVTLAIIGLNAIAYTFEAVLPNDVLSAMLDAMSYGPKNYYNVFAIFSSMFMHGSISHIFFNMLFLWIFGAPVEERLGWQRFLTFYLLAGFSSGVIYTGMGFLQQGAESPGAIGASGAVSGIMALYIYRCFYAKLKMIIDPMFIKLKFSIPALPFVLFYYVLPDLYAAINYSTVSRVAHWGHIGGFAMGLLIARYMRYGHEGRLETLREQVNAKLHEGKGLASAEKELLKILDFNPHDPEIKLDLARLYTNTERPKEAMRFYSDAIAAYFVKSPTMAAQTVIEYVEQFKRPMDFNFHLKAAEILVKEGAYEKARRLLLIVLKQKLERKPVIERTLALFTKLNWHLGRQSDAQRAYSMMQKGFPKSRMHDDLMNTLVKEPGTVFAPPPPPPATEPQEAQEGKTHKTVGILSEIAEIAFDPIFLVIWIIAQFLAFMLSTVGIWPGNHNGMLSQLIIFTMALGITIEHRTYFIRGIMHRRAEARANDEFRVKRQLEQAMAAARNEQYPEAAELIEQYLESVPGDLNARYNLARIYEKHLREDDLALSHFEVLMEKTAPGSPGHDAAKDAIATIKTATAATPAPSPEESEPAQQHEQATPDESQNPDSAPDEPARDPENPQGY